MHDELTDQTDRSGERESALGPGPVAFTGNDVEGVVTAGDSGTGTIPGAPAGLDAADQGDPEGARGTITDAPVQDGTPFGPGTTGQGAGGATVDNGTTTAT